MALPKKLREKLERQDRVTFTEMTTVAQKDPNQSRVYLHERRPDLFRITVQSALNAVDRVSTLDVTLEELKDLSALIDARKL